MNAEEAAALRKPFDPGEIGKLPRITCGKCRDAQTKCCGEHKKAKCAECDNWITTGHMHLDYVGHGSVRSRLLEVDPGWWWEPLAWDANGLPLVVERGRDLVFWIRLSVLNTVRIGVGTVDKGAADADKQLIGDALRNTAMSFGVALDLWIKAKDEAHAVVPPAKRRSGKVGNESPAATASGEPSKPATVPSPAASRACHTCGEPITGAVLVLEGQKYHKTDECRPGNPLANEARAALAGQNVEHS